MPQRTGFRIEGTWLRSRLARRIFLMFCAMAFVPAALVFWLAWRQADRAIDVAERRNVHAETRFVAFSVLSRLQSAQALLVRMAGSGEAPATGDARVFDAIVAVRLRPGVRVDALPRLQLSPGAAPAPPRVVLLVPRRGDDGTVVLYAGALSPRYLWPPGEDVVDGTRVCVSSGAHRLGCAGRVAPEAPTVRGSWALDLHEFGAPPWRFDAERETAATRGLGLPAFVLLVAGVLLMAVLMSLVQIRRMLVPLEALMDRIRVFAGARGGAAPRARDELAALTATFEEMRERIGGQLARLRGLSAVDSAIVSREPLAELLARVAAQLRALPGIRDAAVAIEPPAGEAPSVHLAAPAGEVLDRDAALALLAAAPVEAGDDGWQCVASATAGGAEIGTRGYCLRLGRPGEPQARVLIVTAQDAPPDRDTRDAARQLADRVAIALALDARERKLVHQARHDLLTGLPNRLAAIEALEAAIGEAAGPFAVVFVDLDRFKAVNDGLGHALGDGLLVEVAARLRAAVPAQDLVARFGGDEFVLLLHARAHPDALDPVRARIDQAFAAPVLLDGHAMALRYSAGVAFHPEDGATAQDLVRKADVAMYRAKQQGGGRFAIYSPGMDEAAREEVELVAALRDALQAEALDVHFQPRIHAGTGAWEGMEALVRWHVEGRGWIPPARFVPLAERHGLIDPLGAFVLRTTCAQIAAWRRQGLEPGRVAINVSSEQLRAGTLVDAVARIVADTGVRWADLEVEITESLLITDAPASALQLQALRDRGATVAIDDFGTGYSALAYLVRLPLDTIKIDRAFVVALDEPGTEAVVKSVLALAATLGKRIVTEGVETDAQLRVLRAWGCEVFQGYLFHRPMPAREVGRLLETLAAPQDGPGAR